MKKATNILPAVILPFILSLAFTAPTFAQTAQQSLETIIDEQGAIELYHSDKNFKLLYSESQDQLNNRYKIATEALNKIISVGTAEQIKAAKFYLNNIKNDVADIYRRTSDFQTCLKLSNEVEQSVLDFKNSNFPIIFKIKGQDFQINQTNIESLKPQIYFNKAICLNELGESRFKEAYQAGSNYLNLSGIANFKKFYMQSLMLKILFNSTEQQELEMASVDTQNELSLQTLENYTASSKEDRIKDNENYPKTIENIEFTLEFVSFSKIIENNEIVDTKTLNMYGKSVALLYDLGYTLTAKTFFNFALKKGYDNTDILRKTGLAVATATKNNALGISILDKIVPLYALADCENIYTFSNDYYRFGDDKKGNILYKQAKDCKLKKINDSISFARNLRRNQRNFHFFLGLNLIPAFSNSYGGVLNIGAKNFITEFSYLNVKKQEERYLDLDGQSIGDIQKHNWDGYVGHMILKSVSGHGNRNIYGHSGILFGLSKKTFEPFSSIVTAPDKRTFKTNFAPTNKQYIAMLNFGFTMVKFFGVDFYVGIGGAYNTFESGNSDKELWDTLGYTYDDKMINYRKKNYWSLIGRAGISIGIGSR